MRKEEFYLPSTDGKNTLHCIRWLPEGEPIAVLQIVHGMVEHIARYENFAQALCMRGMAVVGDDHLGHGLTAARDEDLGYICPERESDTMVADIYEVTKYVKNSFPGIPNYILGHSMGSFLTRKYLTLHSGDVDKAIIMGTGFMPAAMVRFALGLTNTVGKLKGERHRSRLLTALALGSYNKRFTFPDSPSAWLTKDPEIVRIHDADKYATFTFTVNAYRALFSTLVYLAEWTNFDKVRRDLPVLIVSGADDPVGDFGKGPTAVFQAYKERGMQDVTLKLYEGDRHEITNELDRETVYADLYAWLTKDTEVKPGA
ncbi:MAG: alpha/beta fold hydrolase [Oscillospiraceae bacterium]|nr:alpha/beta fold hydrolase [Oscillospiraceae bacterium]